MMLCLQAKMPREGTWVISYKKISLSPHPTPPSNLQLKLKKYFKKFLIFSLVLEAKMENILKINFGLYN